MNPNTRLYGILALLSIVGYVWIGYHFYAPESSDHGVTVCFVKNVTGMPCPSCGTTRSVLLLATGNVQQALFVNPLGVVTALALVVIPLWILKDLVTGKSTLVPLFLWTEKKIKTRKAIYIPLVALVLLNWGWNVLKDL